jgi:hypothetical protein
VYSFRKHLSQRGYQLPDNAAVVSFHGKRDPWGQFCQQIPWIRQHYPSQVAA